MKWRATFEVEYYNFLKNKYVPSSLGKTMTRVVEKDTYDDAVIYTNALVGECLPHVHLAPQERLARLMFIKVAPDDADLNENCKNLKKSQERAERNFSERSGQDVIEAWKRSEALGF